MNSNLRSVRSVRSALVALASVMSALSLCIPAYAAGAQASSTNDVGISILGGNASASIVCGNIASASDLARQRHLTLQRSNCKADATGGSVTLTDVEIFITQVAAAANRDNPVLKALGQSSSASSAYDRCTRTATPGRSTLQHNVCWAKATGGQLNLQNVSVVNHLANGSTRVQHNPSGLLHSGSTASATCLNISPQPDERDDCRASATGAVFSLNSVDVLVHNADGSTTPRNNVNVLVKGGNATGELYCFNVTDGNGHVVQFNLCTSTATGGDVTLHNVTINTYE
jgi:hypothetical protein